MQKMWVEKNYISCDTQLILIMNSKQTNFVRFTRVGLQVKQNYLFQKYVMQFNPFMICILRYSICELRYKNLVSVIA